MKVWWKYLPKYKWLGKTFTVVQMTCTWMWRTSREYEGTKSEQAVFRPFCTQVSQNTAEQSQLLKVPFLSYVLSFNTSFQACRVYSSFSLRSLRLNTPLQVLGSWSSFSRTHPPARVLLAPHTLRRVHGCTHGRRSPKVSRICQTEQLKPRKEPNGEAVPAQRWVLCMVVSPCSPTLLHSETWASSAGRSAALSSHSCCGGDLPSSERQMLRLPVVFRDSISRSAFPVWSPAAHILLGCLKWVQ